MILMINLNPRLVSWKLRLASVIMHLSERAKQLIPKARIVSFTSWKKLYPQQVTDIFQQADDEGRYLSDRDLDEVQALEPNLSSSLEKVRLLREKASEIVDRARKQVLAQYPNISQPGGDLYPPERAEACWRDFWHFLRCITYGIAGQSSEYLSQEGLDNMQLLYRELRVPLKAMVLGLESLKTFSLQQFDSQEQDTLAPYFDRAIAKLKQFS